MRDEDEWRYVPEKIEPHSLCCKSCRTATARAVEAEQERDQQREFKHRANEGLERAVVKIHRLDSEAARLREALEAFVNPPPASMGRNTQVWVTADEMAAARAVLSGSGKAEGQK